MTLHCTRCKELEQRNARQYEHIEQNENTIAEFEELVAGYKQELQQLQDKHREVVEKVHYRRQLAVAVYNDPEVTSVRHMKADDEIRFSDWVLDLLQPPQVKTVDEMNAVRSLVALKKCLIDTLRSNPDAVDAVRKLLEEKA